MNRNLSKARIAALNCLVNWEQGGVFAETLIAREFKQLALSSADRHLTQAMVFAVLRNRTWLDHLILSLRGRPLEDMQTVQILRLGLCQLFLLGMAAHAVVFETVSLAPQRSRGLVNAILRNALRQKDIFLKDRENLPLSVRYSTPQWLIDRWTEQFGADETLALLKWNNETPPLYVRTNPLVPLDTLPEGLVPFDPAAGWYRVTTKLPLDLIQCGALYVADPSTRYAVELLNPQVEERILDACAAPGGKSVAILSATKGKVYLTATDANDYRLPALRKNLEAFHPSGLEIEECDWAKSCPDRWKEHFDAVLLDVPCSNSGVIQRRVDVRWRLSPDELRRLATLQMTILEEAAQAVRRGGRLVYSTCSIDAEEDGQLVRAFLEKHPEWTLEEERLTLPSREKTDGSYAALLVTSA